MTDKAISRLRQRLIEDMTIRQLCPKTQHEYIREDKSFADFLGRSPDKATPEDVHARRIGTATASRGARRSASKSSIALALTEAADASFATDQPSRARAERHWAAEIIALGRAGKARKRAIVITVSVSRYPYKKSRPDEISIAI